MDSQARANRLIDLVYEAALHPAAWQEFAESLSGAFDGAAVNVSVQLADSSAIRHFSVALDETLRETFIEHLVSELPWTTRHSAIFQDGFGSLGDAFPEIDLGRSDIYSNWFKPQGLAPEWPIAHTIMVDGTAMGNIALYRREGDGPFEASDLEFGDSIARHATRAMLIQSTLGGIQRERVALAEVIDRLPTGVVLIDSRRQPVVMNRSAERLIALDDGFRIESNGPCASNSRENASLQKLLADLMEAQPGRELESGGFMSISRPSGKRSFPAMVTPLLAAPPGSRARDVVGVIFISNPDTAVSSTTEMLESIYQLTHSEAELVRLLSEGRSLDEAAELRGVSINTARSHLKHAFAKTDTKRQGELVRLVVTGVASLREP